MCRNLSFVVTNDALANNFKVLSHKTLNPRDGGAAEHHTDIRASWNIRQGPENMEVEICPSTGSGDTFNTSEPISSWAVRTTGPVPAWYSSNKAEIDDLVRQAASRVTGYSYRSVFGGRPAAAASSCCGSTTPVSADSRYATSRVLQGDPADVFNPSVDGNFLVIAEDNQPNGGKAKAVWVAASENTYVVANEAYEQGPTTPAPINENWGNSFPADLLQLAASMG